MSVLPTDLKCPFKLQRLLWPDVEFYDKQNEVIESAFYNNETYVPAAHMVGKDFVSAFIVLAFFLTRYPCRIMTTSVDFSQLTAVLWGEMRRFIQTSQVPLDSERGGPLIILQSEIRRMYQGVEAPLCYIRARVAARGEGMAGHHVAKTGDGISRTMWLADEASGVDQESYEKADTWANTKLIIGNPYEGSNTFFRDGVKGGDLKHPTHYERWLRKVIKIRGEDSPNVQFAMAEKRAGKRISNTILIPGVLPYEDLQERRAKWDKVKQCIGIDADFWEGADALMYPPDWLNRAERYAVRIRGIPRTAKAIGIDPAEGGDRTAMAAVDDYGLIELVSKKTPDTARIPWEVIEFGKKHGVPPEKWGFDRGGGGKQHADRLREMGYNVQTIPFSGAVEPELKHRGVQRLKDIKQHQEVRYVYLNKRAQMYGQLMLAIEPYMDVSNNLVCRFAIPERGPNGDTVQYQELRRQMSKIPKRYTADGGRLYVPPKSKKHAASKEQTLLEILGCSPDELDAVVIANHLRVSRIKTARLGAAG